MPRNVIIYASPNKDSFTSRVLYNEKAVNADDSILFDCFENSPAPCDGCGLCKKVDGCKFTDLDGFFADFERAENLTIAFPIYNNSFPAPLKALLDRFQRFYSARFYRGVRPPIKGHRKVTLIITAGSDCDPLPIILAQIRPIFTISGCELKKAVVLTGTDRLSSDQKLTPKITEY